MTVPLNKVSLKDFLRKIQNSGIIFKQIEHKAQITFGVKAGVKENLTTVNVLI